jgi:hypothetical protein
MWVLSFLPDAWIAWCVHAFFTLGIIGLIVGSFASALPLIDQYGKIIKIVSVVILAGSIYFEGGLNVEREWRARVAEMEDKVKLAEEKSREVNTVIKTKYIEKIKIVKETTNANIQYVEKVVTKYDNLCTLSNAAIVLHDSASQNIMARSAGGTVEGTSDVKASTLVGTVTENYGTYYEIREQLIAWQAWYKEQKKIADEVK